MKNKKGQTFVGLILMIMVIIIYILAAPGLFEIIAGVVGGMGSATAFVVKLSMWVILLVLLAFFVKILNSGEGLFTQ